MCRFFKYLLFTYVLISSFSLFSQSPTSNASAPPDRETLDVISIFSDSYDNITGVNYNPYWQQNGFNIANSDFQPTGSGNSVLAYTNFNYQGIEFNSVQDLTSMEFLHLDIWTVNGVAPSITVISSGAEIPHSIPNGDGKWQSIDIPIAGITGNITRAIQLKFTGGNGFTFGIVAKPCATTSTGLRDFCEASRINANDIFSTTELCGSPLISIISGKRSFIAISYQFSIASSSGGRVSLHSSLN